MRLKNLFAVLFLGILACGRVGSDDAGSEADDDADGASGGSVNNQTGGQTGSGGGDADAVTACRAYLSPDIESLNTMFQREKMGRPFSPEMGDEVCNKCPELIADCAAVGQCYGGYCIDNDCSKGLDCTPGGYCVGEVSNHFSEQGWFSHCPGQGWAVGGAGGAD